MRIKTTETKSKLALLIIVTMLLGIFSPAMAAGTDRAVGFTDIENHWAKDTIIKWTEEGLIKGYEDGKFKPDNNISRAEFMAVINRVLGFNEEATIEFSDVGPDDWFYADVAKAVKAGYIEGYEDGSARPNQDISRQEAVVALSRALGIAGREQGSQFTDGADIADWSLPYINALTEEGYIEGYSDGSFQARRSISRAEAVTMLDKARADIGEDTGGGESEPEEDGEDAEAPDSGGGSSSSGNGGSSSSVEVSAISVSPESITLAGGSTSTITATVSPTDATDKTVTWTSSDEDIVRVDETGNVTAVGVGTATITATADGKSATCEVTVEIAVSPLSKNYYAEGDELEFTISGLGPNKNVKVFMPIYTGEGGWPWTSDELVLQNMDEEAESGNTIRYWVGTTDENGVLSVSGKVGPDLPNGELYITLPDYGYNIDNGIELQDSQGIGVRVVDPEQ